MVLSKNAQFSSHSLDFTPLYSQGIGLIDAPIVLSPSAEVHSEEGGDVELVEIISIATDFNLRPKFYVDGVFWEGPIPIENIANTRIDADRLAQLVGGEDIDPLITQIPAIKARVTDEELITDMRGLVPEAETPRPLIDGVVSHGSHEKVGISVARVGMV